MRIPDATLSEIRNRLDIAEVVGEYVTLKRKGGRYWGLCPFHSEKSPSFTVTPEKGLFYCFGCGKYGTMFDFVMEAEKVPWRYAAEILAKKAGIEIPREDEERGGIKREPFFELYRRVAGSFHWLLKEGPQAAPARKYLEGRGVSQEILTSFQLGYAPADREWLFKFLTQKSYSPEFLALTGLFIENPRGRGGALFADRIMYPICNARGEVLAFGGRSLGDAQPKYLNSPETAFFRKGENLFGLDKAGPAIRQAGFFIVVEGYMDVLAMHQAGFTNCVAPLGTALTEQQVRVLKRYAAKALVLFDGDAAGQKATARAIEMMEAQDLLVQAVELPGGQDPADLVQKGETEQLRALLNRPQDSFPYLLGKALASHDISRAEGKEGVRDFLFPYVAAPASSLRRDGYLSLLADTLGTDVHAVRQDFSSWQSRSRYGTARAAVRTGSGDEDRGRLDARAAEHAAVTSELFLMLAVAANRNLFSLVRNGGIALQDFEDERARSMYVALEDAFRADEQGFDSLCARIEDPVLRELAMRKVASGEFDMNQERIVADGVRRMRQRALLKRIDSLSAEMRRVEKEPYSPARMRELVAEKMHLDEELERLKTRAAGA
jgi:DNA primase